MTACFFKVGVPIDLPDEPRKFVARQLPRRRVVEHEDRVRVILQEARCDHIGDRFFDRTSDDARLVLAEGEEDDALRIEDRADAHRDRAARDVFIAKEITRRIEARDAIEGDQARPALAAGTLVR